uniref:Transposase n=1 Tax=Steinernema glaseri TaxID=37863 RepID=A0A1I7Y7Z8_9BILA
MTGFTRARIQAFKCHKMPCYRRLPRAKEGADKDLPARIRKERCAAPTAWNYKCYKRLKKGEKKVLTIEQYSDGRTDLRRKGNHIEMQIAIGAQTDGTTAKHVAKKRHHKHPPLRGSTGRSPPEGEPHRDANRDRRTDAMEPPPGTSPKNGTINTLRSEAPQAAAYPESSRQDHSGLSGVIAPGPPDHPRVSGLGTMGQYWPKKESPNRTNENDVRKQSLQRGGTDFVSGAWATVVEGSGQLAGQERPAEDQLPSSVRFPRDCPIGLPVREAP